MLGTANSFNLNSIAYKSNEFNPSVAFSSSSEFSDKLSDLTQRSSFFGSSFNSNDFVTNGILETTDPSNPTRLGSFSDDYYLSNLAADQLIQVNLSADFDTFLQLVNANTGEVIDFNDDSNDTLNSQLSFTAHEGIDYIARMTTYGSGITGDYTLITNSGVPTSATPISGNQDFSGTITTSDPLNSLRPGSYYYDGYYLTNLIAGQQIQINLNSPDFDTYLQVVNANTNEIVASNDDANGSMNSQLTFTAQPGVDYIAQPGTYDTEITGNYTLTTRSSFSNGTLETTDPSNPTRPGSFSDDYYLSNLPVDQLIQVNLNADFDTFLQLVNANTGEVIDFNDDSNDTLNSQLSFTAQAGVDYIARVTSYESGITGEYTLITNKGTPTLATPISTTQSFSGTLTTSDPFSSLSPNTYYDGYYLTNLVAGQQVQINLDSFEFDTYLQVVNANTNEIVASNDDANGSMNSQLTFTAQAGVDYIAQAGTYGSNVTGSYTLTTQTLSTPDPNPNPEAKWTFMIYLDGDNNLEDFGVEDFLEMASIGSTEEVNIVVQFDRTIGYDSAYGDWTDTRRGIVYAGDTPDANWGTSIGEANMGDSSTLTGFVNWATTNYQAENYALVLWNHGGGWDYICGDDTNYDYLTAEEVSDGLDAVSENIDLIGADACQMGMIEFAHQIQDNGSVFVGSQQLEPGDGWTYDTILSDLTTNSDWSSADLGTAIVNRYQEFYDSPYSSETLSAVNLSTLGSISSAVSNFATTFMSNATSDDQSRLAIHRNNAASYTNSDFRDLGTIFASVASDTTITESIRVSAEAVLNAYNSTVISNFSATSQAATGLSIYFQADGSPVASNYNSSDSAFAADTQWDEFLNWWSA